MERADADADSICAGLSPSAFAYRLATAATSLAACSGSAWSSVSAMRLAVKVSQRSRSVLSAGGRVGGSPDGVRMQACSVAGRPHDLATPRPSVSKLRPSTRVEAVESLTRLSPGAPVPETMPRT